MAHLKLINISYLVAAKMSVDHAQGIIYEQICNSEVFNELLCVIYKAEDIIGAWKF